MDTTFERPAPATAALQIAGAAVRGLGYALFFAMLFVPSTYRSLKGALLGVTLAGIVGAALITGRVLIDRRVVLTTLGFAAVGVFFVLRGDLLGAPGALQMFNVYVTWPLVYTMLAAGAASPGVLSGLMRVLVWASLAVSVYSIVYVLWAAGYWPDLLYYPFDQGQAIGFHGAYVEFGLYSTSTLLFTMPFLVGALFVFPKTGAPISRPTLWLSLALNLITVLLSGRRALLVLVPLAPALALYYRSWLTPQRKRDSRRLITRALVGAVVLAVVLGAAITAVGGIAPSGFGEMVSTGFQFNSDPVAMSRRDQFAALIDGWTDHPLLGSGHGMPARGVIRSVETPWSYELSYVALLFHTGLLGTAAYAAGVAWMGGMAYLIARRGWPQAPNMVATLVGTSSFLVANATNPYLEKYDYLWVIFLPIAFVNCYLVEQVLPAHDR